MRRALAPKWMRRSLLLLCWLAPSLHISIKKKKALWSASRGSLFGRIPREREPPHLVSLPRRGECESLFQRAGTRAASLAIESAPQRREAFFFRRLTQISPFLSSLSSKQPPYLLQPSSSNAMQTSTLARRAGAARDVSANVFKKKAAAKAKAAAPKKSKSSSSEGGLWLPNTARPAWLDGSLPGDRGFDPLGLSKPTEYIQVRFLFFSLFFFFGGGGEVQKVTKFSSLLFSGCFFSRERKKKLRKSKNFDPQKHNMF